MVSNTIIIVKLPNGKYAEMKIPKKDRHLYPTLSTEELELAYKHGEWEYETK